MSSLALPRDLCRFMSVVTLGHFLSLGRESKILFLSGEETELLLFAPLPPPPLPSIWIYLEMCFKSAVLHFQPWFCFFCYSPIHSCSQILIHSQIVCVSTANQEPLTHKLLYLLNVTSLAGSFPCLYLFVLWIFSNKYLLYLYKEKKTVITHFHWGRRKNLYNIWHKVE